MKMLCEDTQQKKLKCISQINKQSMYAEKKNLPSMDVNWALTGCELSCRRPLVAVSGGQSGRLSSEPK